MDRLTIENKIQAVLAWHEDKGVDKGFDPDFIYSLENQYDDVGRLSDRQIAALDSIIVKWMIPVEDYL
jgi:hypothetical protein